ncbi:MAG: hypothetical protein RL199_394 [Pseudomonadota bacterium]
MGVTTVLVPVDEAEVEAWLEGGPVEEAVSRTARLRRRVARVDAVREELHALLFPHWAGAARPRWSVGRWVAALRRPGSASASTGWDPFVHLFGRSLPVTGADARAVAATLAGLVDLDDDDACALRLEASLSAVDARAGAVWRSAPAFREVEGVARRIECQRKKLACAVSAEDLAATLPPLARLVAWSRPVWRFDGHALGELLAIAGIGVPPEAPSALLEERFGIDAVASAALPSGLGDFTGTGGYLTGSGVKLLAGALRLGRMAIAKRIGASGEPAAIAMRHLRLLEEAVVFCEAKGYGLWETAGLEWHEGRD